MSNKPQVTANDFAMFDARATQGKAVARALDNHAPIPDAVTIRSHAFEDFVTALTPKRFELLRLSKPGNLSISDLAAAARRDPSAVSKDIARLVELGLVCVVIEVNAGHGVKKIVRPVARHIEISAALF